ncbi:MAG: Fic family protein [Marinifilum sp.]|jgi:Fic family protein|nr:Fic family protein [Marinifilum sp.]
MENKVHTFRLNIDWELIRLISQIDRFDASWSTIEKKEGQSLKQLKSIATVRSVGASTRIEGSQMSDEEVEVLLREIDITKIVDRDSQEVVGYFETLDLIAESYTNIAITENNLKNLHNILLKHSSKDEWHKGDYKQHSNAVEANLPDGTKQIVFQTTEAGFPTQDAMRKLIDWYNNDNKIHPLVKSALFAYDFVSIHPFQDGNGRLSRLISTLLLLKHGYKWIQYVSFEHEIERRKTEYYRVLRSCQSQRPNEDITEWINFFFNALGNIQELLMKKLESVGVETKLSPKEKSILTFIGNHAGCKSGEIAKKLGIPTPTVKRILPGLIEKNLIEKHGIGPGTNYIVK